MAFFMDRNGTIYPTGRIQRIGGIQRNRLSATDTILSRQVTLDDDETLSVDESGYEEIMNSTARLVPALPKTFVLGPVDVNSATHDDVFTAPVLAWAVRSDGLVTPFTLDGANNGVSDLGAILMPDGTVHKQYGPMFSSIELWFSVEQQAQRDAISQRGS